MIAGDGPRPAPTLSNGLPSTLGNWHRLCVITFGIDSPPTLFIKARLDEQGPEMAVLADEGQLLLALMQMAIDGQAEGGDDLPPT